MKFKTIQLPDIVPDPNQPRKFFDPAKITELAQSIAAKGVHTPITVRPIPGTNLYMLVVGERRFRASGEAGLKEIPCIVRTLTDEETLDIQIDENLNREGVHPLEEGLAFARLLTPDTILQTVADRFGRSVSYIHKRAKLASLVPTAQELFFSGKIDLDDAQALCRLSVADQDAILKEAAPKYNQLHWYCEKRITNLKNCLFDPKDKKLYPEAGACTKCPYNTANAPTLFDDMKGTNCTRSACFTIKTDRAYTNRLKEMVIDGGMVPVVIDYRLSDDDKRYADKAKEMGVEPLNAKLYNRVWQPHEPDECKTFADWFENECYSDYDLTDPAEEKEAKQEYDDYVKESKEEMEDYVARMEEYNNPGPNVKDAFVIAGSSMGEVVKIEYRNVAENGATTATDGNAGTDMQIIDLEAREALAASQDFKNLYKELERLAGRGPKPEDGVTEFPDFYSTDDWLHNGNRIDTMVACLSIFHKLAYGTQLKVWEYVNGDDHSDTDIENLQLWLLSRADPVKEMLQFLIYDTIFPYQASREDEPIVRASFMWMGEFMPNVLKQTTEFHNAAVATRKDKLEKRIAGIRKNAEKEAV